VKVSKCKALSINCKDAQIAGTSSPERLHFVRRRLVFLDTLYNRTCFMSLFWSLQFRSGFILICAPLGNHTERSPPWEANSRSLTHEIPCLLRHLNVYARALNGLPLQPLFSHMNLIHIPETHVSKDITSPTYD
jgi:hypothetical protein